MQAKLLKSAVTKALQAVKDARPLSLQSGFEQRMGCLADISRLAAFPSEAYLCTVCDLCTPYAIRRTPRFLLTWLSLTLEAGRCQEHCSLMSLQLSAKRYIGRNSER